MDELKKSLSGGLKFFTFCLLVPYSAYSLLEFEATSHNTILYKDGANISIHSEGVFFR